MLLQSIQFLKRKYLCFIFKLKNIFTGYRTEVNRFFFFFLCFTNVVLLSVVLFVSDEKSSVMFFLYIMCCFFSGYFQYSLFTSVFLQYSCLENPMDRGSWRAKVNWVAKSWTQLSDRV